MKKEKQKKKTTGKNILLHVLKTPYYIGKGIISTANTVDNAVSKQTVRKKRSRLNATYQQYNILNTHSGDYKKWEEELFTNESKIGIILGARGSGKSAIGISLLENIYARTKRSCYAMGFRQNEMPSWITVVDDIEKLQNNAAVLIDEGGILFSSRNSMSAANKLLSELILVARHKNLTILFISQNSANLEINILRQADFLVLKPTSLLQKDFERKKIKTIYSTIEEEFKKHADDKGATHIYADSYRGFVSNPLPSFWNTKISKSFE